MKLKTQKHSHLLCVAILSVLFASPLNGADAREERGPSKEAIAKASWEKVEEKNGIAVFKKKIPGFSLMAFKGQAIVDVPIGKLVAVALDDSRKLEWIDSLKETRVIRTYSKYDTVKYVRIATPFILKDRDLVTRGKASLSPEKKLFRVDVESVEDELAPKTDLVRGEIYSSSFEFRGISPESSFVKVEIISSPKGTAPNWAVNLFQKQWPIKTIENIVKQATKEDVVAHPDFQDLKF